MTDKITQAREALESIVDFYAWNSEQTKNSARMRITASLGKERINSASSALTGTAQSLAKLSREKVKDEQDAATIDGIVVILTGASLLAKHFEKPAPEVTEAPATESAPAPVRPRATRRSKTKSEPEQAPDVPAILAGLTPALTQSVSTALTPRELALLEAFRATL